jgi:single-strand DNA-binding protein
MNKAILVGRVTKDPELRKTSSSQSVVNFTVAINRTFTNANGEREADFINCVVWGKQAENMATYVAKGSLIGVDGRIQTRNYEDVNGNRVYVTEVVADNVQYLDTKGASQTSSQPQAFNNNNSANNTPKANHDAGNFFDDFTSNDSSDILSGLDIADDDLPF